MRSVLGGVVLSCLCLLPGLVAAQARPRIVNGTPTAGYPTVGVLLFQDEDEVLTCTGVLIGCETFLTAAHCVCPPEKAPCQGDDAPDPFNATLFFEHAGFFSADSIAVHPSFDFPAGDVAVVRLGFGVSGIAPSPLRATPVGPGTAGTIVGFGTAGGGDDVTGLKRDGAVTTITCDGGLDDVTSVCWRFTGTGSNTCGGDSGGPLFVDGAVAGTTSGGKKASCLATDTSFDARLSLYHDWIVEQGGEDLANTACGYSLQIGEPGTNVTAFSGTVDRDAPESLHQIVVPEGTEELRVGFHGADDGRNDFEYYLQAGSPPTDDDYECADVGPSQYGYCEVFYPDPGVWWLRVQRVAGDGVYQIAATTLGTPPEGPECGNDVLEPGEVCDGIDADACIAGCDFDCVCLPCPEDLSIGQIQLAPRFLVRGFLRDTDGLYEGFDPRSSDLFLSFGGNGGAAVHLVIPADDSGWESSRPAKGHYVWRGRRDGLRRLVLRDRTRRAGGWALSASGRALPGADHVSLSGLTVVLRTDYTCAMKHY